MQKSKVEEDLYEMTKPLARLRDDEDLDKMLMEQEREGDPMLAFLKRKKTSDQKEVTKRSMNTVPNWNIST